MSETIPVYAIHIDTVRRTNWTPLQQSMPARMEKARRYRFERDRLLCVGAGLLMRRVPGIHDESGLRPGRFGKPRAPGYRFSVCGQAPIGALEWVECPLETDEDT